MDYAPRVPTPSKDTESLRQRLEAHLRAHASPEAAVRALEPLHGGACQDNYRVEVTLPEGPRRFALRSDAVQSLPGSLSREQEYAVLERAVAAGVRTPAARWLGRGLVREGAWAYLMDWAEGEAIGRRVLRGPELAGARAKLHEELAVELAKIHSCTPENSPGLSFGIPSLEAREHPADPLLRWLRKQLDAMVEPHPALELALRWLDAHKPEDRAVVLVHGDFRTGNFLVAPQGLTAVLDWEFSHWGSPFEDLGWICVRDWRFGQTQQPVGGFAQRGPFFEAYARASGRPVDFTAAHYYEVLGNVRWAAGSVAQSERYLTGGETDLELVAIGRRAVEMEWEALRLMERGPLSA